MSVIDPEEIYEKSELVGRGNYGDVWKGKDKATGEEVAIKIIDLTVAEDEIEDIQHEIIVLSQCECPYVTKYFGSYLKETYLWVVMEFLAGGSCKDLLLPGTLQEHYVATLMREVLKALEFLHNDHKIHRDIKAANILLSSTGHVKLSDFGVSGQLSDQMTKRHTFVGTPFWMAPEIIKQVGHDYKVDIWSTGITAIELVKVSPPHSDLHPMMVLFMIPKNPPPTLEGDFSDDFKDFVFQCLEKDPEQRPNAKTLLDHSFIKNAQPISILPELIERKNKYIQEHPEINTMPQKELFKCKWPTDEVPPDLENTNIKIKKKKRVSRKKRTNGEGGEFFALNQIIYPALKKLIEKTDSQEVLSRIGEIKKAFDTAEDKKPGVSDKFVALVVETLKLTD